MIKNIYKIPFRVLSIFMLIVQISIAQVNYDESKIPDYTLPEILKTQDGRSITTVEEWEIIRRPEILQLFETNVYGNFPGEDIKVDFKLMGESKSLTVKNAHQKFVEIRFSGKTDTVYADLLIYLPDNDKGPFPLFLGLNFYGNHTINKDENIPITDSYVRNNEDFFIFENHADERSRGIRESRWPVEMIIERGYGLAIIYYGDLDPDFDDGFKNGLHKLIDYENDNDPSLRSSISAWAFGLSSAMDYFEVDNDINESRIAVIGHSRLGKTSLWAGAIDKRFSLVVSNNSGCGGAALSRRRFGETVKRINTNFPHWFSKNFHSYNDREDELPVDQHMLIGLIAPRPVYVASAVDDKWADPKGEFLSLFYSAPVFKLYGFKTFENDQPPAIDTPVITGKTGYHIRTGKHNITDYDWKQYLDFADSEFKNN